MKYLLLAVLLAVSTGCSTLSDRAPAAAAEFNEVSTITSVLITQKDAWNAGDIDAFMEGYWRSPELRFASGGKVTKGWQETLDRYKGNYTDRAKMGVLDFTELEVVPLARGAAVVHGRWKLTRESDAPHGLFTLVFRKIDDRWRIVSDTTTSGGS